MMTKDRRLLEQLIKQWAQDHTVEYTVADYTPSQEAMRSTQDFFTYVIQNGTTINLINLADKIEFYLESRRNRRSPDGMICHKCKLFYDYAEPNQEDGSMVCYSCRHNPYR